MANFSISPEFWAGRRVLLTGHTGFKGSWLALWLTELNALVSGVGLEGDTNHHLFHQLRIHDRISRHYIADIRDEKGLAKIIDVIQPEVVIHLAAQSLVKRSYCDPLGTWATNVQGSLNLLEGLKPLQSPCAVVMVTTDKVYTNQEWDYGYREVDPLGGHDPYSASKAGAELAIASWRKSFCGDGAHQTPHLSVATARAGNVIGGGDWSEDRIIPDTMRALAAGEAIKLRNPNATRPWQHVLEPLGGYLLLAERLAGSQAKSGGNNPYADAFNFGPQLESNRSVRSLINEVFLHWPGQWQDVSFIPSPHEAGRLHLQIEKAYHRLGWQPRWQFSQAVYRTVKWYHEVITESKSAEHCCLEDLATYSI